KTVNKVNDNDIRSEIQDKTINENEVRTPATTIEQNQINQISNLIIPNTIKHPINQISNSTDLTIPNTNEQIASRERPLKCRYVSSIKRGQIHGRDSAYSRSSTCSRSLSRDKSSTRSGSSTCDRSSTCGGSSTRGFYKCHICGQTGHNSAFHKKR
ncbi:14569_t:CDS:2, partial [Dentiscutata erythropus]